MNKPASARLADEQRRMECTSLRTHGASDTRYDEQTVFQLHYRFLSMDTMFEHELPWNASLSTVTIMFVYFSNNVSQMRVRINLGVTK